MSSAAIKAGGAFIEISEKGLDKVQTKMKNFAEVFDKHSQKVRQWSTSIFVSSAAGIAAIVAVAKSFANTGEELFQNSRQLGMTVEQLGKFKFAAEQSGAAAGDLEKAIFSINALINEAKKGNTEAMLSFAKLGLSVSELGQMTPDQRFLKFLDAVSKFKNPTQLMDIGKQFGISEDMITLLMSGRKQFEELTEEAAKFGYMSEIGALAARQLYLEFSKLWWVIKLTGQMIGAAFAPAFIGAAEAIIYVLRWVNYYISEHKAMFRVIGAVIGGVLVLGTALGAMGLVWASVAKVIGIAIMGLSGMIPVLKFGLMAPLLILKTVLLGPLVGIKWLAIGFKALLTPILLVTKAIALFRVGIVAAFAAIKTAMAGSAIVSTISSIVTTIGSTLLLLGPWGIAAVAVIAALAAVFIYAGFAFTTVGDKCRSFGQLFNQMSADFGTAWVGIKNAIEAGNIALIFEIMWATIKLEWTTGTNYLMEKWIAFKDGALNLWVSFQGELTKILLNVWNGFLTGVGMATRGFQRAWNSVFMWFKKAWTGVTSYLAKGALKAQNVIGWLSDEEFSKQSQEIDDLANKDNEAAQKAFDKKMSDLDKESKTQLDDWQKDIDAANQMTKTDQEQRRKKSLEDMASLTEKEKQQRQELINLTKKSMEEADKSEKEREQKNPAGDPTKWEPMGGAIGKTEGTFNGFALATGQVFGGSKPELVFLRNIDRNTKDAATKAGRVPRWVK